MPESKCNLKNTTKSLVFLFSSVFHHLTATMTKKCDA
uniref:Uncharacterized protein n=1 Tax=Anguilla anguilla TaxID=7936 RepID=A0A0E9V121_ANGAN